VLALIAIETLSGHQTAFWALNAREWAAGLGAGGDALALILGADPSEANADASGQYDDGQSGRGKWSGKPSRPNLGLGLVAVAVGINVATTTATRGSRQLEGC